MKTNMVQFVSEKRKAWTALTTEGARPTDKARYMNTDNSAVDVVFPYCTLAVKATAVVNKWVWYQGVKERQARLCAEGSRTALECELSFNGPRSDEKVKNNAAPASTCLSAEPKASTSGDGRAPANSGVLVLEAIAPARASGCSRSRFPPAIGQPRILAFGPMLHLAQDGNTLTCSSLLLQKRPGINCETNLGTSQSQQTDSLAAGLPLFDLML